MQRANRNGRHHTMEKAPAALAGVNWAASTPALDSSLSTCSSMILLLRLSSRSLHTLPTLGSYLGIDSIEGNETDYAFDEEKQEGKGFWAKIDGPTQDGGMAMAGSADSSVDCRVLG